MRLLNRLLKVICEQKKKKPRNLGCHKVGFVLSKALSQTKENEEEGSEKKEIKGMKLTLTPFNVVFGFDEIPKSE